MKRFLLYVIIVFTGIIFLGATKTFAQKMKQPIMWEAENMKWKEMKNAPPGITMTDLWGNMINSGEYGQLVKFPPNQQHPLHTHSNDMKVIVISGTFLTGPEGGAQKSYGPGSYLFTPAGWKHTSGAGPEGCTIFQEQPGKFDMVLVKAKGKK